MKFLDLFAGIGGFRLGMEQAGHECVGFVEIDKFARKSYEAIYDTEGEWTRHDITQVSDNDFRSLRGKVDIITGGFPCQAFSIAGRRGGFEDARGTLFFDVARAAKQIQPQYLFLENVKGLLNHDKGRTFRTILTTLDELGYDVEWRLLNSKYFGVPQNRERVFIIGHLRRGRRREILSFRRTDGTTGLERKIKQIAQYDSPTRKNTQSYRTYAIDGIAPTLNTMGGGGREPHIKVNNATKVGYASATVGDGVDLAYPDSKTRRGRVQKGSSQTLTANNSLGVAVLGNVNPSGKGMNGQVYKSEGLSPTLTTNKGEGSKIQHEMRIRKLTPRECWRLQGFPDWTFDEAEKVNSNSQLYKQAGNSVTVPLIHEIAKKLSNN